MKKLVRCLQVIGLPPSAKEILHERFESKTGEVVWRPKYKTRLCGYTEPLFYSDRCALHEYVNDKPPVKWDEYYGMATGDPFQVEVLYYEELQGDPLSSGPCAHLRLIDAKTKEVVAAWPETKDGHIDNPDM